MQDFKKLFNYLSPYRSKVILSVMCHVLMAIFTVISIPLIIPFFHFLFSTTPENVQRPDSYLKVVDWLQYYFIQLIDNFGANKALILTCVFLLATIFLKNLFRYLAMFFMVPVRSGIVRDLRNTIYSSFLNFSFDEQKDSQRGDLLTRINSDVQEIEWNILRFIDTILKSPIIIVGAILLMLSISYKLTAFVFVLMLFTVLVIGTLSRKLKRQSKDLQDGVSRLTSVIDETLDGVLMLNVYRVKNIWSKMFGGINNEVRDKFNKVVRRQELSSPLSEFLGVSVVVVLLWYGAKLVMNNELQPEAFFAFVLAFYHVIEPLKSFSTAYYYIKKGAASLERIEDIVIKDNVIFEKRDLAFTFNDELSLDKVSYSYDNTKVLNEISFKIKKGQKVALVGASGSGKSTITRLLLQIIKPDKGQLKLDALDMWKINKDDLYKSIGFVTQQPFLYNESIRNNILLGRTNIDDTKIEACLKLACADELVNQLSEGLDTIIGDRGSALSGGEQQRLTIARALLEDPEILILDEPTSALDPQSEKIVSQAIINILEDRTAIIVAHRLSTIKFVDYIFVLDKGMIVESGTHEELSQRNGIYANYVKIQSVVI